MMRCDGTSQGRESSKWLIIIWAVVIYDRQYKSPIKSIKYAFVQSGVCGGSSSQSTATDHRINYVRILLRHPIPVSLIYEAIWRWKRA